MGVISVLKIAKNDENKAFRHLSIYSILMRERERKKSYLTLIVLSSKKSLFLNYKKVDDSELGNSVIPKFNIINREEC